MSGLDSTCSKISQKSVCTFCGIIYILQSVGEFVTFVWPGAWLTWRQNGRGPGLGQADGRAGSPSHNRAEHDCGLSN